MDAAQPRSTGSTQDCSVRRSAVLNAAGPVRVGAPHGHRKRRCQNSIARTPGRAAATELAGTDGTAQTVNKAATTLLRSTKDEMLLPKMAHWAVVALSQLHAMLDGAAGLLADEAKTVPADDLRALLCNSKQMTINADSRISKAVQS